MGCSATPAQEANIADDMLEVVAISDEHGKLNLDETYV